MEYNVYQLHAFSIHYGLAHFYIEFELTLGPFEGSLVDMATEMCVYDHRHCVQLPRVCAYLVEH